MSTEVKKHEGDSGELAQPERMRSQRVFSPLTDIYETPDHIVLIADMPGVSSDGLDVTLENRVLTVTGRANSPEPKGFSLVHAEYATGDYERVFALSEEIDRERIEATLENGVLRLVLPKVEAARTRKIAVRAA